MGRRAARVSIATGVVGVAEGAEGAADEERVEVRSAAEGAA